jgi:FMN phosphatase YigB (HAD superfamily)
MAIKGIFFDLYGTLFNYGDMNAELTEWLGEFHVCLENHGLSNIKDVQRLGHRPLRLCCRFPTNQ